MFLLFLILGNLMFTLILQSIDSPYLDCPVCFSVTNGWTIYTKKSNKINVSMPVAILSPIFSSDIFTNFPFSRVTLIVVGKHGLQAQQAVPKR